jgi:hypothetical protein
LFKKLIFSAVLFLPSFAFADRLGGLGRESDVALSTGAIQNTSTLQSGATFYVSSGTVGTQLNVGSSGNAYIRQSDSGIEHFANASGTDDPIFHHRWYAPSTNLGLDPKHLYADLYGYPVFNTYAAGAGALVLSAKGSAGDATLSLVSQITVTPAYLYTPNNLKVGGTLQLIGADNSFSATGSIYSLDAIGTESGAIGVQGSTATWDAYPIDAIDRLPVLNNGTISWDTAVTNGVVESGTSTITGKLTLSKQLIYSASTVTARELFPMSWPIIGSSDTYTVAGSSIPLWGKTHAAITISTITAAVVGTAQDINGDLKFTATDNCLNYNSSTLIDAIDTTGSIMTSGGIDDSTIPAGSCVFLVLDGNLNNEAILQISAEASCDP